MFANRFNLITSWQFDATPEELRMLVDDIVVDPSIVSGMCPSVFPVVGIVEPGQADGTGRVVSLDTTGWLPYSLEWRIAFTEIYPGERYVQDATGDFEGRAVWTFTETELGACTELSWSLRVNKPLLRRLAFLLKPLFVLNHKWAMARARANVQRELNRRRALQLQPA